MTRFSKFISAWSLLLLGGYAVLAAQVEPTAPPCRPCAGVLVRSPFQWLAQLEAEPRLDEDARLYVAWDVLMDGTVSPAPTHEIASAGGTPWARLVFTAPLPLMDHLVRLEAELEAASAYALGSVEGTHFQILWRATGTSPSAISAKDYAFLVKRAAVAVSGGSSGARVISQPLSTDPDWLATFYGEDVAAYLDGLALPHLPMTALGSSLDALAELDPGKPVVIDSLDFPEAAEETLAQAAEQAVAGAAITFFDTSANRSADLGPLKLMAREFKGDLAYDPYSTPTGDLEAWSFVRGEDLGLRVIVRPAAPTREVVVTFSDRGLKSPSRVLPGSGEVISLFGAVRTDQGLELPVSDPGTVALLRLERLTASEIEGIQGLEDELTVTSERQLPVEEILRRLQAFDDAQYRKLDTYRAINTTHLRFQLGTEGIEVTFEGQVFFRQDEGFDWAWERFLIDGLRWKGKRLPQVPLIEPARAAQMPLVISFGREYTYHLRGTDVVEGRDCWVVDFRPNPQYEAESLFRGTVWVDREIYARVRTRAVQLRLEGEVISNEETLSYSPIDSAGQPAAWAPESYFLPLKVVSQQVWSLFNVATVIEKEASLSLVAINDPDFETRREQVLASEVTMVRETDDGLRYLVVDHETGERVVQEEFDPSRLFAGGGVFYDQALDFPLPLAGVDWFSLDLKGTGAQANVFFAGPFVIGHYADPELRGSKYDAGAHLVLLAVPLKDAQFRDSQEVPDEEVKKPLAQLALTLGRRFGSYTKINLRYGLGYDNYRSTDNTVEEFVLPEDHFTNSFGLSGQYNRNGYRLSAGGRFFQRTTWEPWGLPGSSGFDPDHKDYTKWSLSLSKTFHLAKFRRFGVQLEYVDGRDLDRFSKYQFGFFSDTRIRGFQSDRVRAERAALAHLSYGFDFGEVFRLQMRTDVGAATDEEAGLDEAFLAGIGVAGNFIGPWQTIVRLDLGVPVAGPDDGFSLLLVFLKLLH